MKNLVLIFLLLIGFLSYSQRITRGPDIGEIYFLGPTHTGTGLYYSTDFGETAVCVDSVKDLHSIEADKLQGGIYGLEISPNLYFSDDFGNAGSWEYKTSGMYPDLCSGVIEGYVFNNIESHSENYGTSFINHNLNGFFGNLRASEIDNQIGTGYAVIKSSLIPDSIFFFITYDTYDNLILKNVFHKNDNLCNLIRRGINNGELFSLRYKPNSYDPYEIYYSENFGDEFLIKNELNIINYYSYDIEGGTEEGEFFLLYNFVNLMWQNAHIYIYHSTDYGVTFEVFHPFSKGNEPVLSNFSTIIQEGEQPLEVEFCNYSIGEVSEYQWDFENDGTIDSYEQSPIHIYPDTGYYSVRLTIIGTDSSNTFLREDYIHVKKLTGLNNSLSNSKFTCYPNPFTEKVKITYNSNGKPSNNLIMIYNNTGKLIKTIIPVNKKITNKNHVIWDGTDENGDKCNAGFYYVNLNMKNSPAKKILLIN